ncbi:hypothetical protein ZHAS_00017641 [Anopheles sinensis]|uniref:Uncharacterized protein n=1 Tax=Anopheles sinensis TaxID=74873 RepID=A0A084WHD1_ANOSI|nr:hypothetical protein ZHAS_00017641 [Anopheles sinensis]
MNPNRQQETSLNQQPAGDLPRDSRRGRTRKKAKAKDQGPGRAVDHIESPSKIPPERAAILFV